GAEITIALAAEAWPSGTITDAVYEELTGYILDEVKKGGYDGILLDLHGAMVAESFEDGEGELLRRIRAIDATTPVGVTLDMHTNLFEDLVNNSNVISGYHTYPHIDMREAGERTASIIVRAIKGEVK